jgi:A/G-specific adenine glycosylase
LFFRNKITYWYENNRRDLPWRRTADPYNIWISEVILQQTRINQGINYYYRFIELFPTVEKLAKADEELVLKVWQGLGYYSRARNLRQGAIDVVNNYNGKIPTSYKELLKIKGIGEYTAAAIASIAFNEPVAAIDGNVFRVLSRFLGISEAINSTRGKIVFRQKANELMDIHQPGTYNQAVMEFGALACAPKKPDCDNCPLASHCFALKNKLVEQLPVKLPKNSKRTRFFSYFIIIDNESILLNKRTQNDIWKNMFDFPCIETNIEASPEKLTETSEWLQIFGAKKVEINKISKNITHLLTHQKIVIQFIHVSAKPSEMAVNKQFSIYNKSEAQKLPCPKPIVIYIEKENLF